MTHTSDQAVTIAGEIDAKLDELVQLIKRCHEANQSSKASALASVRDFRTVEDGKREGALTGLVATTLARLFAGCVEARIACDEVVTVDRSYLSRRTVREFVESTDRRFNELLGVRGAKV